MPSAASASYTSGNDKAADVPSAKRTRISVSVSRLCMFCVFIAMSPLRRGCDLFSRVRRATYGSISDENRRASGHGALMRLQCCL